MSDTRLGDPIDQQAQEPLTPRKRGLFRRGEDGLTTLEWLLIVAAVAGLAALAVVLVQNVVDDTAEQISGSSARETAAKVAASSITRKGIDAGAGTNADNAAKWNTLQGDYEEECERIEITYGDIEGLSTSWNQEDPATPMTDTDATAAAWTESLDSDTAGTDDGCQVTTS